MHDHVLTNPSFGTPYRRLCVASLVWFAVGASGCTSLVFVPDDGGTVTDTGAMRIDTGGMVTDTGGMVTDTGGMVTDTGGMVTDTGTVHTDTGPTRPDASGGGVCPASCAFDSDCNPCWSTGQDHMGNNYCCVALHCSFQHGMCVL